MIIVPNRLIVDAVDYTDEYVPSMFPVNHNFYVNIMIGNRAPPA